MKDAVLQMVERFDPQSRDEYDTALKETIQRICLLGLWRSRFFEHAAFYGGTALRLLYGLDRFSEDLDFSLLVPDKEFRLTPYFGGLKRELEGFGFEAEINEKAQNFDATVVRAFVKSNTRLHFIRIGAPERLSRQVHRNQQLKVKLEVDPDPPPDFSTEIRYVLQPVPHSVRTFATPDLFAGKMHALLCRRWGNRVKGRDWYDLVWYVRQEIPMNLSHLMARMHQTDDLDPQTKMTERLWRERLDHAIHELDIDAAKQDVRPFIRNAEQLEIWSKDFFRAVAEMIKVRG